MDRTVHHDAAPPGDLDAEGQARRIERVEKLAEWLDARYVIPGTNFRIGGDGIIGLIPGVGDTITAGLSAYIIGEAVRAGCRKRVIAEMGWNAFIDWLIGMIPLVGDIFDVAHKANAKNARLLVADLKSRQTPVV